MPETTVAEYRLRSQFDQRAASYREVYDSAPPASLWHHEKRKRAKWTQEWLAQPGVMPANSKVLDAGCGDGYVTCSLAQLPNVDSVTGVDLSSAMLLQAETRARQAGVTHKVDLREGSVDAFSGPWNVVVSLGVVGYQAAPLAFVKRLADAVVPGGWLVLTVGNPHSLARRIRSAGRWFKQLRTKHSPFPFQATRLKKLDRILQTARCERIACRSMSYGIGRGNSTREIGRSSLLEERDLKRNSVSRWWAQTYWLAYRKSVR